MIDDINRHLDALRAALRAIYKKAGPGAQQSQQALPLLTETQRLVKDLIRSSRFDSPADEIRYFRHLKPAMTSKMIYHLKVYHFELRTSGTSEEWIRSYCEREMDKITAFYTDNAEFIRYIRSEDTLLDKAYFLRDNIDFRRIADSSYPELDPEQTTLYDIKIAKLYAYEDLARYISGKLKALDREDSQSLKAPEPPEPTDSTATRWIKSHQVEHLLKIAPSTLHNLRKKNEIPFTKIGGIFFYDEQELLKWLKGRNGK